MPIQLIYLTMYIINNKITTETMQLIKYEIPLMNGIVKHIK